MINGQVPGGGCSRNGLPVLPGYVWHRGDPDREARIEAERAQIERDRPRTVQGRGLAAGTYRGRHPEFAEQDRAVKRARWRAMLALARRHEAEYGELYAAELERQR
jgi:hypothetical protein